MQATILKMNVRNSTDPVEIPVDSTIQELLVSIIGPLISTTVNIRNPQGKCLPEHLTSQPACTVNL